MGREKYDIAVRPYILSTKAVNSLRKNLVLAASP